MNLESDPAKLDKTLICRGFDLVVADHLAPALDLTLQIFRGAVGLLQVLRIGLYAARGPDFRDFRIGQRLLQGALDRVAHGLGHPGWRQHDLPEVDVELRAVGGREAWHAGEL